jgi:hypothetical protein
MQTATASRDSTGRQTSNRAVSGCPGRVPFWLYLEQICVSWTAVRALRGHEPLQEFSSSDCGRVVSPGELTPERVDHAVDTARTSDR